MDPGIEIFSANPICRFGSMIFKQKLFLQKQVLHTEKDKNLMILLSTYYVQNCNKICVNLGEHDILNFVCLLESKFLLPSIFVFGAIFNKLVRKYWRTLTLNDPSVFARSLITYILYTLIGYPWPGSIVV